MVVAVLGDHYSTARTMQGVSQELKSYPKAQGSPWFQKLHYTLSQINMEAHTGLFLEAISLLMGPSPLAREVGGVYLVWFLEPESLHGQ